MSGNAQIRARVTRITQRQSDSGSSTKQSRMELYQAARTAMLMAIGTTRSIKDMDLATEEKPFR